MSIAATVPEANADPDPRTPPQMSSQLDIRRNLNIVRESIAAAARAARRDPDSVRLVAVTKTFPVDSILAAYREGVRDIGENRIEEARDKIAQANSLIVGSEPIRWNLIGHLQRRKAREAVELFELIQSVDSVKLAETIDRHATFLGKRQDVLLQVNVAGDPNKFGFLSEPGQAFFEAVARILDLPSMRVQGLMTIGPLVSSPEQARPSFRALRELRDDLARRFGSVDWRDLSMGMTDDFPVAIAEGATIVRIGRAIFGERN